MKLLDKAGSAEIDRFIQKVVELGSPIYRRQVIKWIDEIKRLDSYADFKTLSKPVPGLEQHIEDAIKVSYHLGQNRVKLEVEAQLQGSQKTAIKKPLLFAEAKPAENDFLSTFKVAQKLFEIKSVVDYETYKNLQGYSKQLAFSVARLEHLDAIQLVKDSFLRNSKAGGTFVEWRKTINVEFEKAGWTPLSPHHLETVFRTNLMSIYNGGKWDFMQSSPDVESFQFFAVGDDRMCETCTSMDGKVFAKDDPIWDSFYPPLHYQCRCAVIPITKDFADRNGIEFSKYPPDDLAIDPAFTWPQGRDPLSHLLEQLESELKKKSSALGQPAAKAPKAAAAKTEAPIA